MLGLLFTVFHVTKQDIQPEDIDELVVWRRFSEFKKLHKDLSKYYSKLGDSRVLPSLPKTTYFDRFDDGVIEERRKNILSFLNFVSEVPQLAEHECLDKFFGGGMYAPTATSSSRTSSFSGSEGDASEVHKTLRVIPPEPAQDPEQGKDSSDELPQGGFLELGGVWLCKQPSLVEGLDSAGNEDTIPDQAPTFIQTSLSFEENNQDNVFTANKNYQESSSSGEEEEEEEEEEKTSGWLQRAISLCSEGEDIETLASEAENDDYIDELNFPKPFSDVDDEEASRSDSETSRELSDFQENSISNDYNATETNCTDTQPSNTVKTASLSQKVSKDDQTISQEHEPYRFVPQQPSFDCSVDDYLVAAANIVRDALTCELDGQYKESFHLYKKCVSLLLHGVQEEKDSKRRDAVRRKTAQYLLKAEALYTAYIHETNQGPESTQTVSPTSGQVDDYQEDVLTHLQLSEFSVIGIIGKVILVEKKSDKTNYAIKVLSKTEGQHSRHKSKRSKRRRHFVKAAYSKCPFIVALYQHCETDTAVFLLLQHAKGGLVRDHLIPSLHRQDNCSKSQSYVHNLKETELNKTRSSNRQNNIKIDTENSPDKTIEDKGSALSSLEAKRDSISTLESCIRTWMAEIVLAVAHLHKHGIICRDLNPNNVLLSESGHVLLTHFSTWNDVNEDLDLFSLELNYCAPELFKLGGVTKDADWWSVGALFFEMLVGEALASHYPWGIRPHTQIEMSTSVSTEAESLIKELLVVTPSERLGHGVNGVDDIQTHPFFSGINWKTLEKSIHQSLPT